MAWSKASSSWRARCHSWNEPPAASSSSRRTAAVSVIARSSIASASVVVR